MNKGTFIRLRKDDFGERGQLPKLPPERRNIFFFCEASQTKILTLPAVDDYWRLYGYIFIGGKEALGSKARQCGTKRRRTNKKGGNRMGLKKDFAGRPRHAQSFFFNIFFL